jgi:hypothetical protein
MDHTSELHLNGPKPRHEIFVSKLTSVPKVCPFVALAFAALFGMPGDGWSEPADLSGSWRGSGWVSFALGSRERARCRAYYVPRSGSGYAVDATCATESGSISQSATLRKVGSNTYAGGFYNREYDVSGNIHVVVHGNSQSVTLTSNSGTASLTFTR